MERPYDALVDTPAWPVLLEALSELTANQDIALTTDAYYVIGFLIRRLLDSGLLVSE